MTTATIKATKATKGDKRYIQVGRGQWELCELVMLLGSQLDRITGRMYREAIWARENGRRITGVDSGFETESDMLEWLK